jgi:phage terminase large subunit
MEIKRIKLGKSFKDPLLNASRILLLYGGAGSGKSEFAARKLILRCLDEKNHRFLILRKVRSRIWESVVQVILDILEECEIPYDFNRSLRVLSFLGNDLIFDGLDDPDKIKSIKRITGIWMEEATEFTKDDLHQLNIRMRGVTPSYKQVMLTFNPDEAKAPWIKEMFFEGRKDGYTGEGSSEGSYLHHSTIEDNPIVEEREEYRGILDGIDDPVYQKIYRRGHWGLWRGLIYDFPTFDKYPSDFDFVIYGLDFGYNNPTSLIRLGIKDLDVYLFQDLYERKLTTPDLISKMEVLIKKEDRKRDIYADSSEPDRIEEIFNAGFNVMACEKGQGSVNAGIVAVKKFRLISREENGDLNDEFRSYKWKEDKNGNPLDEPVKFKDHGLDGVRYAIFSHFKRLEKKAYFRLTEQPIY